MIGVERFVYLVGQKFLRDRDVGKAVIPQNGINLIDFLDLFLESCDVLIGHILHDNKRKRAFSELLHQDVLTFDGVHILGQIRQHIIVDTRVQYTEESRNHQNKRDDDDRDPQFDNQPGKLHFFTFASEILSM